MSAAYKAVNWNRQKFRYDGVLAAAVLATLLASVGVTLGLDTDATLETALIRGLGATAFALLTVILLLGPLARLDRRALPLLYNRRHLGVTMALLALAHATFALVQFHALGDVNPFVSLLDGAADWRHAATFPFELLGLAALIILLLMAATSHDYWLATLTAPVWKALHMLAYPAYALLVGHVALGSLQSAEGPLPGLLEQKVSESTKQLQCVKVTLLASLNGYAPALAVEFGRKILYSTERPSFSELEEHVKSRKGK